MPEFFRVNLYRRPFQVDEQRDVGDNVGEKPEDVGENEKTPLNDKDAKATVLKIIINNNKASAAEIAKEMLVTQRTVERYIKELREEGNLIRHGSARGGYWEVVK